MPLKKGTSRKTISENIAEFHDSEQYKKTKAKSGKERADKQAVAVALETARASGAKRPKKSSAKSGAKTRSKTGSKASPKAGSKAPRARAKRAKTSRARATS